VSTTVSRPTTTGSTTGSAGPDAVRVGRAIRQCHHVSFEGTESGCGYTKPCRQSIPTGCGSARQLGSVLCRLITGPTLKGVYGSNARIANLDSHSRKGSHDHPRTARSNSSTQVRQPRRPRIAYRWRNRLHLRCRSVPELHRLASSSSRDRSCDRRPSREKPQAPHRLAGARLGNPRHHHRDHVSIVSVAGVASSISDSIDESEAAADAPISLVYEVTSDAPTAGNVTYSSFGTASDGVQQATDAPLPWSVTEEVRTGGDFEFNSYSLTAQASDVATTITCRITLDGAVISENTSTGAYAIASCIASSSDLEK